MNPEKNINENEEIEIEEQAIGEPETEEELGEFDSATEFGMDYQREAMNQ